MRWYQDWSHLLETSRCRVPRYIGGIERSGDWYLLLEDLDAAGYPRRRGDIAVCLKWLANFHATFLGAQPTGLWETGTYWHLATRPNELEAIKSLPLKKAAAQIDARLSSANFQTLVHGDAKLANFCFGDAGVAAVDFQYVGGGCGMKDVAYLISCLDETTVARKLPQLLNLYFNELRAALSGWDREVLDTLEHEWRTLFPWASADFIRFLEGWALGYDVRSPREQLILHNVLNALE